MTGDDLKPVPDSVAAPPEMNQQNKPELPAETRPSRSPSTLRIVLITVLSTVAAMAAVLLARAYLFPPAADDPQAPRTQGPAPVAQSPRNDGTTGDDLQTAFSLVFPSAQAETTGGQTLLFKPGALVPLGSGTYALLSDGTAVSDDDSCHACTGALRVTYLYESEGRLRLPSDRLEWDLPGNGYGAAADWKVIQVNGRPAVEVSTSGMTQGCTYSSKEVYQLDEQALTNLPELAEKVEC